MSQWENYKKNYELLYIYGNYMGLIKPFDKEIFQKLRNVYYNHIPAVMLLLDNDLVQGHCYDRAKLLAYAFKDEEFEVVTAKVDGLRYRPDCLDKYFHGVLGENYAEHCFVRRHEEDGRTWIYDTSLGLAIEKNLYIKMQHPEITSESSEEISLKEIGCTIYSDEESIINKEAIIKRIPPLREKLNPIREEYIDIVLEELDIIENGINNKVLRKTEE